MFNVLGPVKFEPDEMGVEIGSTTIDAIGQDESATTFIEWQPQGPYYLIRVVVDMDEEIDEYIEGNIYSFDWRNKISEKQTINLHCQVRRIQPN